MNTTNDKVSDREWAITYELMRLQHDAPTPQAFSGSLRAALSNIYERGHEAACAELGRERERLEANDDDAPNHYEMLLDVACEMDLGRRELNRLSHSRFGTNIMNLDMNECEELRDSLLSDSGWANVKAAEPV